MVYTFFDKGTSAGGAMRHENMFNKELAEELQQTIIRKFKKLKVDSLLKIIYGVLILPICN